MMYQVLRGHCEGRGDKVPLTDTVVSMMERWEHTWTYHSCHVKKEGKVPGGTLEKGTDCGPSAAALWLSHAKIAKKEGLSSHCECALGAVKVVYMRILHQIIQCGKGGKRREKEGKGGKSRKAFPILI